MLVLTVGLTFRPRASAFRASNAAPTMTDGLLVLVHDVVTAMATEPWSTNAPAGMPALAVPIGEGQGSGTHSRAAHAGPRFSKRSSSSDRRDVRTCANEPHVSVSSAGQETPLSPLRPFMPTRSDPSGANGSEKGGLISTGKNRG